MLFFLTIFLFYYFNHRLTWIQLMLVTLIDSSSSKKNMLENPKLWLPEKVPSVSIPMSTFKPSMTVSCRKPFFFYVPACINFWLRFLAYVESYHGMVKLGIKCTSLGVLLVRVIFVCCQ